MGPLYPIIDGFLYDSRLKCDLNFKPLALQQFDDLRRSQGYAQSIVTVPEDPGNTVIPARNVYRYDQRCTPGAAFWAYSFIAPAGNTGLFSVQCRDSCSDVPLFAEPLINLGDYTKQIPLPRLFVIGAPGQIHIEICSLKGTDLAGVQFILWGGHPRFPTGIEG